MMLASTKMDSSPEITKKISQRLIRNGDVSTKNGKNANTSMDATN